MKGLIDLHVHTTASDGTLSPKELIEYAEAKKLLAVAITDHDTIDGLAEAIETANSLNYELVPGVEISVEHVAGEMHILGYFIDIKNEQLVSTLSDLQRYRAERNPRIAMKLQELGMDITLEEVKEEAGGKVIGRPHFAAVMVKKGYVNSVQEAFQRYLAVGQPAYMKKEKLMAQKGIELINGAGGIPVLAHPKYLLKESVLKFEETVKNLKELGLKGLECYYTEHSSEETSLFMKIADELDLYVTGGTDFHGSNKPQIELGIGKGSLRIPYELLARLKQHKN